MTLAELIEDAKSKIADASDAFFGDNTWTRWINEGQRVVVRQTKILQYSATTLTTPGKRGYTMADEFWTPNLVKLGNDILYPTTLRRIEYGPQVLGRPSHYYVWGKTLMLYPTPSTEETLLVYYYAWPSEMSDPGDTPDIPEAFHDLLSTWAAYRALQADKHTVEARDLYAEFQQGIYDMLGAYDERQEQNNRVVDVYSDHLDGVYRVGPTYY